MSEIQNILQQLEGTRESEIIKQVQEAYEIILEKQTEWYKNSKFTCMDGCGECCRNFEPDILDCEALYFGAWLLENQNEVAMQVAEGKFPFENNKGCLFWNENDKYHCTCYGARAFICRLFGASGYSDKNGEIVFKPCKFFTEEELKKRNSKLEKRQFSQSETKEIFGCLPPVMSDLMEKSISINPDNTETELIRYALPKAINRLLWIINLNKNK